jgi:heme-degrading monooxygenase HmoA
VLPDAGAAAGTYGHPYANSEREPVIARIWKGVVRREDADAYAARALDTGLAAYAAIPGNRGAGILRRDSGSYSEFVAFSLWDSLDGLHALTGDDVETDVYYLEDDRYLMERDPAVVHFEVAGSNDLC